MSIDRKVRQKLTLRGFTENQLINNSGLIAATIDEVTLMLTKKLFEPATPKHYECGVVSPLVDQLVEDLFNTGKCYLTEDHYDNRGPCYKYTVLDMVLDRLSRVWGVEREDLYVDPRECYIYPRECYIYIKWMHWEATVKPKTAYRCKYPW